VSEDTAVKRGFLAELVLSIVKHEKVFQYTLIFLGIIIAVVAWKLGWLTAEDVAYWKAQAKDLLSFLGSLKT